jgi:hypothetical protein
MATHARLATILLTLAPLSTQERRIPWFVSIATVGNASMEVVAAPQSSEVQTTISQITSLRHEDLGSELFVLATNFLLYIALVRAPPLSLTRIIYPGSVMLRFSL